MHDIIEKVARAMAADRVQPDEDWKPYAGAAKTAILATIEALKEPTCKIDRAGLQVLHCAFGHSHAPQARAILNAMLEAARQEIEGEE